MNDNSSRVVYWSSSFKPKRKLTLTRQLRRVVGSSKLTVGRRRYFFSVVVYGRFKYGDSNSCENIDCDVARVRASHLLDCVKSNIAKIKDIVDFDYEQDISSQLPYKTLEDGSTTLAMTINFELRAKQFFDWFGLTTIEAEQRDYSNFNATKWKNFLDTLVGHSRLRVVSCGPYHDVNWNRKIIKTEKWIEHEATTPYCVKELFQKLDSSIDY